MHELYISRLGSSSPELQIFAQWRYDAFLKSYGLTLQDSLQQLERLTANPDQYEAAFIARLGNLSAGICLLVLTEIDALHDASPWLASLYVAPEFRNRGIGRKLVEAVEQQAASNGVPSIHLYTGDAEQFYLKCGWTITERGIADGEHFAFMAKQLLQ